MTRQILPGSYEETLQYLIDRKIDISKFDAEYRNDETGAPAISPKVLLKIVLYCYSRGLITSRPMARACTENMTVKAMAEDIEPHFSVIADFISKNSEKIKDVFTQVLMYCSELGLIKGDLFAIDGCKLPSNASKEWSGTIDELKKKKADLAALSGRLIEKHKKLDAEDKNNGELSKEERTAAKEQRKRHIERINKKMEYIDQFFVDDPQPRLGTRYEVQSNITDNESAKIKGPHGVIQGYNGIAVADSANQVIVAADVVGSVHEGNVLPDMLDELKGTMQTITGKEEPLENATVLGDTGYFSEENLEEAEARNVDVLIPDQQFRKRDESFQDQKCHENRRYTKEDFTYNENDNTYRCPAGKRLEHKGHVELNSNSGEKYQAKSADCKNCPLVKNCVVSKGGKHPMRTLYISDSKGSNILEDMRNKIDDPRNRELYGRRMQIIEPCFADIEYCKKMNRFSLRGKRKVTGQWLLFCMVHNIGKCVPKRAVSRRAG